MIDPQRLRDLADTLDGDDWRHPLGSADLCRQAADELERLRQAIAALDGINAAYRLGRRPSEAALEVIRAFWDAQENTL